MKPVSGKWSAHEQLAHLARYHQVFLQRIDRILSEQAPEFPRYRAEYDPNGGMVKPSNATTAGSNLFHASQADGPAAIFER